jgi:AhpD family alkylhydroperoxidase
MEARMQNPLMTVPGAADLIKAFHGLQKADVGFDLELVSLRASLINGCTACVDMHSTALLKAGEPTEKVLSVGVWRESPHFTDAERAALALTEEATRIADRGDRVPDGVWNDAADHFTEEQLATIVLAIATINFFNRVNVAIHQPPQAW